MKLGVVGYGSRINSVIKDCLRHEEPGLRVVGIVDPDKEGVRSRLDETDRKDVSFYDTVGEMIKKTKPDCLAIGTRCNLHTPYAIEAAGYDIPLYLEKPVAVSMKQAVKLEKAFEKSRCEVVVSFPLRVSPICVMTKQLIEDGSIGHPEHILGVNYVPYGAVYFETVYRNYAVTQGLFLQKATHDFDYMMYLMGSSIVKVCAMATKGRIFGGKKKPGLFCSQCDEADTCLESPQTRKIKGLAENQSDHSCLFGKDLGSPETGMNEDSSSALVEFASGGHGAYTQVFFARRDSATRGAIISGYKGTLSFDWYKNEIKYVRHHVPFSDTIKSDSGLSHFGGDFELARNFISVVKRQGKIKNTHKCRHPERLCMSCRKRIQ